MDTIQAPAATLSAQHIDLTERYAAHNYAPLPVVIARAEGVWMWDADGVKYLDMLAAYSAINFGHAHPELLAVARAQLDDLTLTSRAFYNNQLGPFCKELAALCGMEMVLPMNTGAEAVETAIKTARKWGYTRKGVPEGRAKIVCCSENFHGRTTTIVSFSTDPQSRNGFGPFTPGFEIVPYGDADALAAALDENTVAFLVEPIQGEAGIIVPPDDYLARARALCTEHNVLFIADEIQSGLGRTGATFTCDLYGVRPDVYVLGKALGGGILPISAVASRADVLGVFTPGDHGSTFGGNPLACAVVRKVVEILQRGTYQERARQLGAHLFEQLEPLRASAKVKDIRGRGLWVGIELHPEAGTAKHYCKKLMAKGLLCKDTHEQTMRLAPPLCITRDEIDWAVERIVEVLT